MRELYLRSALIALTALIITPAVAEDALDTTLCWKDTKTRGVGSIPDRCSPGETKDAGLCYPGCPAGYSSVGPLCWRQCPAGWEDIGVSCKKPTTSICNGHGWQDKDWPLWPNDGWDAGAKRRCKSDHGIDCETKGGLAYPKCADGWERVSDQQCARACPAGMRNDGLYCAKDTIGRGVGKLPNCGSGEERDGGLCYPSCGPGYDGVGPVCWGTCGGNHPTPCGAACATSEAACAVAIGKMVVDTFAVAANIGMLAFPGASQAFQQAVGRASDATAQGILASVKVTAERTLMTAVKDYALFASKGLASRFLVTNGKKAMLQAYGQLKDGGLESINKAAGEFAVLKDTSVVDLTYLTALDPTGVSSMVLSFAKFKTCKPSGQFALSKNSVDFGSTGGVNRTIDVQLVANRRTAVTGITTPAFRDAAFSITTDCIGRTLSSGQSCMIHVGITSNLKLDTELRIYTDLYSNLPFPVDLKANLNAPVEATFLPEADDAVNNTLIQGAWAINHNQADKATVDANGIGRQLNTGAQLVSTPKPGAGLGRAFLFQNGGSISTWTLNSTGDRLSNLRPQETALTLENGKVLDVFYLSMTEGSYVGQNPANGGLNQTFRLEQLEDGTWRIQAKNSGLYLTLDEARLGANLRQDSWRDSTAQRFRFEPVGNGTFTRIVHVASGNVLTAANGDNAALLSAQAWKDAPTQRFRIAGMSTWLRRPWAEGCQPGETRVDGKCYDIPPGWELTVPGQIGKLCPADWADNGQSCTNAWTGAVVYDTDLFNRAPVADPNGNWLQRHPLKVTSCTQYSMMNGQNCPANWVRSGTCDCSPTAISKEVRPLAGR